MSRSALSSLKHKVEPSVLDLIKHKLQACQMASKTFDVDLFILALLFRFWVILAKKIGHKI